MPDKRYKLVFYGQLGYGFELEEVKTNLQKLCRFDRPRVEQLFSGRAMTLKSGLTEAEAKRYKAALDRTGAIVHIEPMPTHVQVAPQSKPEPASGFECPKCGFPQEAALTCMQCGIVFEKYRRLQARQEEQPAIAASGPGPDEEGGGYFTRHREQAFLLKAFAMIVAILFVRQFLSGGLLFFAFLLFPVLFLTYIRLHAATSGENPSDVLAQHITFMPVMYTEGERKKEGTTWVTYGLIAVNILIFYGIEIRMDPQVLADNYFFLPHAPNAWNVPVSAFTTMFLHAGGGHLWGNMIFLWTVGTVVERRIGAGKFLALYLVTGLAASFFGVVAHRIFFDATLHALGASGAIAGVMGIFAVRCYFKSMVFPLPILGIFSLILPISLKVRLNSLVIIGLFFLGDLSGGFSQVANGVTGGVGHWIHVGGMLAGVALAMLLRLGDQAVEERHMDVGARAVSGGGANLEEGEESLRIALRRNPNNLEAMLMLARILSKFGPSEEGGELYRRAIAMLVRSRPQEAKIAFCQYHEIYLQGIDAEVQYRLAGLFHQDGDLEMASRCLEPLLKDGQLPAAQREKVLFQYARILDGLGLAEAAADYYRMFVESFPDSVHFPKARARLA
jgi:membrane associated rhomboid family serine protease